MCQKKIILNGLLIGLAMLLTIGWAEQAQSQVKYPTRTIDIIVPYGAGGSTDLSTRIMADYLKKKWRVSINIVNKPGGATVPATLEVYRARPDGYTLFADNWSSSVPLELTIKDLPFKVMDRTYICMNSIAPYVITVHSAAPYKSFKDLLDDLKRDPENFTYVSCGSLCTHDIIFRQACKVLGVDPLKAKPILVTGAAEAAVLTAGGNVKMGGGSVASQLVAVQAGTVRALALGGKDRWPTIPNVPSTAELGYPTVKADQWNGVSGPPKLPRFIVEIWEKATEEMAKDPEVISKIRNVGSKINYLKSEEVRKSVMQDFEEMKILWGFK